MTAPVGTDIHRAAELLQAGKLVAFATETVYGLGANALDVLAVARVFEVKQRPKFDPLIVHVSSPAQVKELVCEIPDKAQQLMDEFWPGPLTLVLPKTDLVPDLVTAGLSSVAIRQPAHPLALQLLQTVNLPIAAPSANPFSQISPTTAAHVAAQLGNTIDYILDGGPCKVGLESTVVAVSETNCTLLRPGGLPQEEIECITGPVSFPDNTDDNAPQTSPGQLSRHYAPGTPLTISKHPSSSETESVGLLCFTPVPNLKEFSVVEVLSESGSLIEAAANFYAALRRLDAANLDRLEATPFPNQGLGRALNDRLKRAATL